MIRQQIELLRKQIQKLEDENFDFLSWKSLSVVLLESVFGKDNEKVMQIQSIEFDQTSWTLRDTSGAAAKLNNCKNTGKEILEIAIIELQSKLEKLPEKENVISLMVENLKDELTGKQFKKIKEILTSNSKQADKKKKLIKELKNLSQDDVVDLLSGFLLHPEFENYFE